MEKQNPRTVASIMEGRRAKPNRELTTTQATTIDVSDMRAALPVGLVDHGNIFDRFKAHLNVKRKSGKYLDRVAEDQAAFGYEVSCDIINVAKDQLHYKRLEWRARHGERVIEMTQTHDQRVIKAEEKGQTRWVVGRASRIDEVAALHEQGLITDAELDEELEQIAHRYRQARESLTICTDAYIQDTHEAVIARLKGGAR